MKTRRRYKAKCKIITKHDVNEQLAYMFDSRNEVKADMHWKRMINTPLF